MRILSNRNDTFFDKKEGLERVKKYWDGRKDDKKRRNIAIILVA